MYQSPTNLSSKGGHGLNITVVRGVNATSDHRRVENTVHSEGGRVDVTKGTHNDRNLLVR